MHQQPIQTEIRVSGPSALVGLYRASGWLGRLAGSLSALTLLLLTLSIVLGIGFRVAGINNTWTYDLDTFMLMWLAFLGAAWTSMTDSHVTAGIALEVIIGHRGRVLAVLRFLIIAVFLVLFCYAAWLQMADSFHTNERTLDVVEWPIWVPKAALPVGALAWLSAEVHKLLRLFLSSDRAA